MDWAGYLSFLKEVCFIEIKFNLEEEYLLLASRLKLVRRKKAVLFKCPQAINLLSYVQVDTNSLFNKICLWSLNCTTFRGVITELIFVIV